WQEVANLPRLTESGGLVRGARHDDLRLVIGQGVWLGPKSERVAFPSLSFPMGTTIFFALGIVCGSIQRELSNQMVELNRSAVVWISFALRSSVGLSVWHFCTGIPADDVFPDAGW